MEKTVKKMNIRKAVEVDELPLEMVKASGLAGINWLASLFNVCFTAGGIQAEWRRGVVVPIWKGKRDTHDPGSYRGIALLG